MNWLDLTRLVPGSSKNVTRIVYDADEPYQIWGLPADLVGRIWIRATDDINGSDRGSLIVNEMFIQTGGIAAARH